MRPLILDSEVRKVIAKVVMYANAHKLTLADVIRNVRNAGKPGEAVGNDPGYTCIIPVGFRCCFSIEQQPTGWFRHISISVMADSHGAMPNPMAVEFIMREFGFRGGPKECFGYIEGKNAINCLEPLEPTQDQKTEGN